MNSKNVIAGQHTMNVNMSEMAVICLSRMQQNKRRQYENAPKHKCDMTCVQNVTCMYI